MLIVNHTITVIEWGMHSSTVTGSHYFQVLKKIQILKLIFHTYNLKKQQHWSAFLNPNMHFKNITVLRLKNADLQSSMYKPLLIFLYRGEKY